MQNEICTSEATQPDPEYLFESSHSAEVAWIVLVSIFFTIPIIVVLLRWNSPDQKPRSPLLILFLMTFLLVDSVGNTVLFSTDTTLKPYSICWMGIFITVICEFGIMLMIYLRMYRINKVFIEYEVYLEKNKQHLLLDKISQRWSSNQAVSEDKQKNHRSAPLQIQNSVFQNESQDSEMSDKGGSFIQNAELRVSELLDNRLSQSYIEMMGSMYQESQENVDLAMRERLKSLQEWNLIKVGTTWFLIPAIFMGFLSLFFPYVFALIPAHESGACICHLQDDNLMVYSISDWQIPSLVIINTVMFYSVNWVFLVVNILMLYRIRNINDKLWVRKEMGHIVFAWTFFCYLQYTFYLLAQIRSCSKFKQFNGFLVQQSYVMSYWIILSRDVTISTIVVWNLIRVKCRQNRSVFRNVFMFFQGNQETTQQLMDFSSVILSVVPLQFFKKYLQNEKPFALNYLQAVMLQLPLQELEMELEHCHQDKQQEVRANIQVIKKKVQDLYHENSDLFDTEKPNYQHFSVQPNIFRIGTPGIDEDSIFLPRQKSVKSDLIIEPNLSASKIVPNLETLFQISREKLESIFKNDFPFSEYYKDLVLFLHDNMVEFNCLRQAGFLNQV